MKQINSWEYDFYLPAYEYSRDNHRVLAELNRRGAQGSEMVGFVVNVGFLLKRLINN